MSLALLFEDIFEQDVDVIVNPANEDMWHGGGLAGMIAHRAGEALVKQSQALAPVLTGRAIITTAGNLPQKAVVHTVGPMWDDDEAENVAYVSDTSLMLAMAYVSAVNLASQRGHTSMAFPAISCGVFRFPIELAAPIAVAALREAQEKFPAVADIRVCVLDDEHYDAFQKALQ